MSEIPPYSGIVQYSDCIQWLYAPRSKPVSLIGCYLTTVTNRRLIDFTDIVELSGRYGIFQIESQEVMEYVHVDTKDY